MLTDYSLLLIYNVYICNSYFTKHSFRQVFNRLSRSYRGGNAIKLVVTPLLGNRLLVGVFRLLSRGANNDHNFNYFIIKNTLNKSLFVLEARIKISVLQVINFYLSLDICSLYTSTLYTVGYSSKQATRYLDRRDIRSRVI